MKKIQTLRNLLSIALLLTLALTQVACSDDDGATLRPTLPGTGGGIVRRIEHLGGVTSSYDWQFTYGNGRLTQGVGLLRDTHEDLDQSYTYTSKLAYGDRSVRLTNSSKESIKVTLNGSGYIEKMTVDRDIYQFYYMDGRLKGWDKTIFENNFGQATQYRSSGVIEYQNGDLVKITYIETDNAPVVFTFTPSAIVNTNGLLPETVSKELGVLGIEHLYYAGLMGRPTTHLVGTVQATCSERPEQGYTLGFEYSIKNGNVVLCNYHTPSGDPASVRYSY